MCCLLDQSPANYVKLEGLWVLYGLSAWIIGWTQFLFMLQLKCSIILSLDYGLSYYNWSFVLELLVGHIVSLRSKLKLSRALPMKYFSFVNENSVNSLHELLTGQNVSSISPPELSVALYMMCVHLQCACVRKCACVCVCVRARMRT